jgi:hypothetical protein
VSGIDRKTAPALASEARLVISFAVVRERELRNEENPDLSSAASAYSAVIASR